MIKTNKTYKRSCKIIQLSINLKHLLTLLFWVRKADSWKLWVWELLFGYRYIRTKSKNREGLHREGITDTMHRSIHKFNWRLLVEFTSNHYECERHTIKEKNAPIEVVFR